MRGYAYLPTSERECIRDMIGVRNNWAHVSAELPGKDTIVSDIECPDGQKEEAEGQKTWRHAS